MKKNEKLAKESETELVTVIQQLLNALTHLLARAFLRGSRDGIELTRCL